MTPHHPHGDDQLCGWFVLQARADVGKKPTSPSTHRSYYPTIPPSTLQYQTTQYLAIPYTTIP